MAHISFGNNLTFAFTGAPGDLQVYSLYRTDGVFGVLKGEVTLEKCQEVADAMGYIDRERIGRQIFEAWEDFKTI
jgi:hypothetical protein